MSLSPSSSRNASSKMCFVIESEISNRYEVYIVDVGLFIDIHGGPASLCRELPPPVFQLPLDYPIRMTFFGFGSKIYFLGGANSIPGVRYHIKKEVYVYDTGIKQVKQVRSMNHDKLHPLVIGPIKEKFYVLSRNLFCMDLEEFTPESDSWKSLSTPPTGKLHWSARVNVRGYAVVVVNDDCKILMSTDCVFGIFSYDIGKDAWNFVDNETLPFDNGALSIGRNLYLVYQKLAGFCIFNYNGTNWVKLKELDDYVPQYTVGRDFPCMSLVDDGALLCAVHSGYTHSEEYNNRDDRYICSCCREPPPTKHHVMVLLFGHGGKLPRITSIRYQEEDYFDDPHIRSVINSFPM